MHSFDKPYILYLAALFHDIAKGRGDMPCKALKMRAALPPIILSGKAKNLLAWLVEDHLLMSIHRPKDIQDPVVIERFCACANARRLTALYLLTVADIRGTNPKLWNDWKANLLQTFSTPPAAIWRAKAATAPWW